MYCSSRLSAGLRFLDRPALDAYINFLKIRYVIPLQRDFDAHLNLLKSRCVIPRQAGNLIWDFETTSNHARSADYESLRPEQILRVYAG